MAFRFLKKFPSNALASSDRQQNGPRLSSGSSNNRGGTAGHSRNTAVTAPAGGQVHHFINRDQRSGGQILIHRQVQPHPKPKQVQAQPKFKQVQAHPKVTQKVTKHVTVETRSREEMEGVLSMEEGKRIIP